MVVKLLIAVLLASACNAHTANLVALKREIVINDLANLTSMQPYIMSVHVSATDLQGLYLLLSTSLELSQIGQYVAVTVQGMDASVGDWLGVYSKGNNVTATAPIKYQYCHEDPKYISTGTATIVFRLINFRADFIVCVFSGGVDHPHFLSCSEPLTNTIIDQPTSGRVALVKSTNDMRVTWTGTATSNPIVHYGLTPTTLTSQVAATNYTYTEAELCGSPATDVGWRAPGTFYTAILTNLPLGQQVFYKFGSDTTGYSAVKSFVSRPAPRSPVNMIAFGDLGQTMSDGSLQASDMAPSRNTTDGIKAELADKTLLFHNGDISYARGYGAHWEEFHDQIESISTSLPYMTAIGNHERDWPNSGSAVGDTDSGGECGVPYERRFPMPTSTWDEPWYSFDYGVIHLIVISTEHEFGEGSPQFTFVKDDLAKIDRTATPWVIFAGHRPFYIDSTNDDAPSGDQPVAVAQRVAFEDMLYNAKVDLVWGAHHHSYQRSCPIYKSKCQEGQGYLGPVVVDLGMAGAGNSSQNLQTPQPAIWKVVDDSHHGYTRVFANTTHLVQEYIRGDDRKVHDTVLLTKP